MKVSVKALYYLLKITGLAPFQFNSQRNIVEKTIGSFCHFLIFGALIHGLTIFVSTDFIAYLNRYSNKNVRLTVIKGEVGAKGLIEFMIFVVNVVHHNALIKLINESLAFQKMITRTSHPINHTFFDDTLISQYTVRCLALVVQVIVICGSFLVFIYEPGHVTHNLYWIVHIYNHFNELILSSIYIYGGFVTSSRFMRTVNNNFELDILSTRRGNNIDGTPITNESVIFQLVQFEIFFGKFASISNELFRIFGFQILLTLTASAGFTLSSVGEFRVFN